MRKHLHDTLCEVEGPPVSRALANHDEVPEAGVPKVVPEAGHAPNDHARKPPASACNLMTKHLKFINLVQGNVLYRTIFISNIKVNMLQF